jgi:hypothetical protein
LNWSAVQFNRESKPDLRSLMMIRKHLSAFVGLPRFFWLYNSSSPL